jgi:hypothetical protein
MLGRSNSKNETGLIILRRCDDLFSVSTHLLKTALWMATIGAGKENCGRNPKGA